ncbi:MAG: membrane integrity-associated transporter subunit PqiC [Reyranella sp.]|uniref:PqiC family protein n=1 Tax=Reyranella sp. TaxID=1929291 RepID=UPI0012051332|nr:PqiC family protein [Reyranella sp.]TAJ40843.1 MAG: membrane integrity-associated transporter subunit PqiC [Reyranella sp.]
MKSIGLGRRRLGVLALPALGLPVLAACGASPEPSLYTLAVRSGPSLPKGPRVVQLRDIGLPGYLDRKEIVRSSEDYKLDVRANAWWGEPMGAMLGRVLVIELSQRLPNSKVYSESGAITSDPNAVVGVDIQRLDADKAGAVILLAQVAVQFNRPTRSVARNFAITKSVPTPDNAGHVAATSDAVAELADGIAALLQT